MSFPSEAEFDRSLGDRMSKGWDMNLSKHQVYEGGIQNPRKWGTTRKQAESSKLGTSSNKRNHRIQGLLASGLLFYPCPKMGAGLRVRPRNTSPKGGHDEVPVPKERETKGRRLGCQSSSLQKPWHLINIPPPCLQFIYTTYPNLCTQSKSLFPQKSQTTQNST